MSAEPKPLDPSCSSPFPLDLLLEDGPLLAFNKPAGLLTQGVPGGVVTLESQVKQWLKARHGKPGNVYLGIPHRLDRPVSGVIVFSRNSKCAARLAEMFRERTVRKVYYAVTERIPEISQGELTDWLWKDAAQAHVTVVPQETPNARQAVLRYTVLQQLSAGRGLLEIELLTGRMHQIRVQLASRRWPVVGDRKYGATTNYPGVEEFDPIASPIALHARELTLKHPVRYDELTIRAPFPTTWKNFGVEAAQ